MKSRIFVLLPRDLRRTFWAYLVFFAQSSPLRSPSPPDWPGSSNSLGHNLGTPRPPKNSGTPAVIPDLPQFPQVPRKQRIDPSNNGPKPPAAQIAKTCPVSPGHRPGRRSAWLACRPRWNARGRSRPPGVKAVKCWESMGKMAVFSWGKWWWTDKLGEAGIFLSGLCPNKTMTFASDFCRISSAQNLIATSIISGRVHKRFPWFDTFPKIVSFD